MQPASAEVVTRPPGVRMILASPKVSPTISSGTIRESMQVTIRTPAWAIPSNPCRSKLLGEPLVVGQQVVEGVVSGSCPVRSGSRQCVLHACRASTCRVAQPGAADPIAAMGWLLGVPDPSRRASAAGRGTGLPLGAAAMAGAGPAQASSRASSPLRNRWQRTPPVARPLAG